MSDGVYSTKLKNGNPSYRSSFTFKNRHISLGSFDCFEKANTVYMEARRISTESISIDEYNSSFSISFEKFVTIINFRDNNVYIKNPIYLKKNFFNYYLSPALVLTFDIDDLFYYSNHKIQKRGNRLFCADFGMQITLNSRYGIKNNAVIGKDVIFINGDIYDYRYNNIEIRNKYYGVDITSDNLFKVHIHINGNVIVGVYDNVITAAIAYNKAADYLNQNHINKNYNQNYIEEISAKEYAEIYSSIDINNFIKKLS